MLHHQMPAPSTFAPNRNSARTNTLLEFVKWCQGREDPVSMLKVLGAFFGAEVAGLSRLNTAKNLLRLASIAEIGNGTISTVLSRGFADVVCGNYIDSLKPGAVVLFSEMHDESCAADEDLLLWMFKRNIRDVAIVYLGKRGHDHDFVEVHLGSSAGRNFSAEHEILTHSLAEVYAGRQKGLMFGLLAGRGRRMNSRKNFPGKDQQLLSESNPASLTRTEWQVCALVASGLSRQGVAKELSVKPCTVQTHLRNIYAKSGFEEFNELAHRLISPEERAHLISVKDEIAA